MGKWKEHDGSVLSMMNLIEERRYQLRRQTMSKWRIGNVLGGVYGDFGRWVEKTNSRHIANRICARHNKEVDDYQSTITALEAERDELQRRLDAVVRLATDWHESNGCVDHWERSKTYLARCIAIVEGRTE